MFGLFFTKKKPKRSSVRVKRRFERLETRAMFDGDSSAVSFTGLGDLGGGPFSSRAWGVSADGLVVVGASAYESRFGSTIEHAFRWTRDNGMEDLGALPSGIGISNAFAASADGSVIVGVGYSEIGEEAFRWTASGGLVGLNFNGAASGVSADGSVIVGAGSSVVGPWVLQVEAFRANSSGGKTGLGDLPGGTFHSVANAVSANGLVIVGSSDSSSGLEAFRWTAGGGMIGLGWLSEDNPSSQAWDLSADGSVIVGSSSSATGVQAYRWTEESGMVGLGYLPGGFSYSTANAVSADGSVIVGGGNSIPLTFPNVAFVWTSASGMQPIKDVLIAAGLGASIEGWQLQTATDVSADGRTIVGYGINPSGWLEGWVATLPVLGLDIVPHLKWEKGYDLLVTYDVLGAELETATDLRLYWANDAGKIGQPIVPPIGIPAGTLPTTDNPHLAVKLSQQQLGTPPAGATKIIAIVDEAGELLIENKANNSTGVQLPRLEALSVAWDAEAGGVRASYRFDSPVAPADLPTFNLYWVDAASNKVSGPLLGSGSGMQRSADPQSELFRGIAAPPANAKALMFVVDDGDKVIVEVAGNNTKSIAYQPSITSVVAAFDGTPAGDHKLGRFFAAPGIVDGQFLTVIVSEEVAALQARVTVDIGGQKQAAQWNGGTTYILPEFDPGQFSADTAIEIGCSIEAKELSPTWTGTLNVEPLPDWFSALGDSKSIGFDEASQRYEMTGNFVDLTQSSVLSVGKPLPFLKTPNLDSSLAAKVSISVSAPLNPTTAPTSVVTGHLAATALGKSLYDESFSTAQSGVLQGSLVFDAQTLQMSASTLTYQPGTISKNIPIELIPVPIIKSFFTATSQLVFTAAVTPKLQLTFGKSGLVSESYAQVQLDGTLTGKIIDFQLGTNSIATNIATRLARLVNATPPALLVTAISQFLPSAFDLRANGQLSLGGRVTFGPGGVSVGRLPGSGSLMVSGNLLGFTVKPKLLPDFITDAFTVSEQWDGVK
jgi:probable HAF family extracellular repeat protein